MKFQKVTNYFFTLLELLLVVSLIMLLMAILIPSFIKVKKLATHTSEANNLRSIFREIESFNLDGNTYPESLAAAYGVTSSSGASGGDDDDDDATGSPIPQDNWGNEYIYGSFYGSSAIPPGQRRRKKNIILNTHFDLYSTGADNVTQAKIEHKKSLDDIIVADDGAFIGVAHKY